MNSTGANAQYPTSMSNDCTHPTSIGFFEMGASFRNHKFVASCWRTNVEHVYLNSINFMIWKNEKVKNKINYVTRANIFVKKPYAHSFCMTTRKPVKYTKG